MNCKWCESEGTLHFGWLDEKGDWQDDHYSCDEHRFLSAAHTELRVSMEQMRQRNKLMMNRPTSLLVDTTKP